MGFVRAEARRRVALRDLHVADFLVRHREIAILEIAILAASCGGVARGEKGLRRLRERASRCPEIAGFDPYPDIARIETRGFRELGAGGVVIELQPVDARLVGEKTRLGSAVAGRESTDSRIESCPASTGKRRVRTGRGHHL